MHSITCFIYDSVRRELYNYQHAKCYPTAPGPAEGEYLHCDPLANVATAAFTSGTFISLLSSPLLIVKTKQQLRPAWSIRDAIQDSLCKNGGLRNLYIGFLPLYYCETVGRVVYFGSYEFMKRTLLRRNNVHKFDDVDVPLSLPQRMFCAQVAGMSCWTFIYPMDVLRCRLYALHSRNSGDTLPTTSQLVKQMWTAEGGVQPFVRGFGMTIARAGPVAAIV